jgi:hypothetical protein
MGDAMITTKPKLSLVVRQVNPIFIHKLWPDIRGMLESGLSHSQNEYNVDQLKMLIIDGSQTLLVAEDGEKIWGAATITFENYPNERIAFMSCIGGKFIASQTCWDQFCEWAKNNGCSRVRGYAHEAVARLWRIKFGVEKTYVIVDKKLQEEV